MIDSSLIISVQNGNKYAFKTLFDLYENKVFRTAYLMLRDKQYAEDVVQDTFLQVYLKLHSLTTPEAFEVWLYKITINQCTNFINKVKKVSIVELDEQFEKNLIYPKRGQYDTENKIIEKEVRQKIIDCIYSLSVKYRNVLILFYYNEMTIFQISQILNCTEGTVKSRLFYGKKKLKKVFICSGVSINDEEEDINYEIQ